MAGPIMGDTRKIQSRLALMPDASKAPQASSRSGTITLISRDCAEARTPISEDSTLFLPKLGIAGPASLREEEQLSVSFQATDTMAGHLGEPLLGQHFLR